MNLFYIGFILISYLAITEPKEPLSAIPYISTDGM